MSNQGGVVSHPFPPSFSHKEAEEAKESKTWEFWEEAVDEFIKKWPPLEKMKALVEESEEVTKKTSAKDLKIGAHRRGGRRATFATLPALKEEAATMEDPEETEEEIAEKMLVEDLNTSSHQQGVLSAWFETMDDMDA